MVKSMQIQNNNAIVVLMKVMGCHATDHFRKKRDLFNKQRQQLWFVRRSHKVNHHFNRTSCNIPETE